MITADQLICHAIGDYILQSDWMATEKTKRHLACAVHAIVYTLVFLALTQSILALLAISSTHFLIDRYRLARYICWVKNWIGPPKWVDTPPNYGNPNGGEWDWRYLNKPWAECSATGYDPARPPWLTVWLLIIADNTLHVIINGLALRHL